MILESEVTLERGPSCLGDDTLIALAEHALAPAQIDAVVRHVGSCDRCRETVGHLVADVAPADTAAGRSQVGRYELQGRLGAGGMGVVWAAWDPMLERRVAIKLLRPEVGEHGPARLLREARALAQLQHPNVVAVYDVGEHLGSVFVATELVDGEPLDRWQQLHPLAAIVDVYVQAARGLAAAHAIGLIHRDVKPSNVFVAHDGRARIGDFGLARRGDMSGERFDDAQLSTDPRLTRDGDVVGTPAYMAPEQRAGAAIDARADQYALCVALGEVLGGARPPPDASARSLGTVAPALAEVVARGLRRDPAARFRDMAALADALALANRPPRSRTPRVLAAAALVAVAAGAAVFLSTSSAPEATPPPSSSSSRPAPVVVARAAPDAGVIAQVEPAPALAITTTAAPATHPRARPVRVATATPAPHVTPTAPLAAAVLSDAAATRERLAKATQDYNQAAIQTTRHDASCKASFARMDSYGVTLPWSSHLIDELRGQCEIVAGDCTGRRLRALYAADGLSAATIADELKAKIDSNCPLGVGTWQEQIPRLSTHLYDNELWQLKRGFATLVSIARQANGQLDDTQRRTMSYFAHAVAEGFARLAGHCEDARQAYVYDAFRRPAPNQALQQCLDGTSP